MSEQPYIFFNKSLEQARLLGARGGRTYARNQRARRAGLRLPGPAVPPRRVTSETAAQAILALDAQFPWLQDAEKPVSQRIRSPWPAGAQWV